MLQRDAQTYLGLDPQAYLADVDELEQMLKDARRSPQEWNDFLDSFVDDRELVARVKANSPR